MIAPDASAGFQRERSRLFGLAYRMLGSAADAEDVLQDAYLRYQQAAQHEIRRPAAFLTTVVTRLCLDRMKSAARQRESYVGTWLPEPLLEADAPPCPDREVELAEDLSFALMLTLERLSPSERAAFLLHDVFGLGFAGVARALGREPAACRKLAERARKHVAAERPRFVVDRAEEERLLGAFFAAVNTQDLQGLQALLSEDAVLYSDGGGKRRAALNPIFGQDRVVRFLLGVQRKSSYEAPTAIVPTRVNQRPGVVLQYAGGEVATTAFDLRDGRIARLYVVSNPDKLAHVRASVAASGHA